MENVTPISSSNKVDLLALLSGEFKGSCFIWFLALLPHQEAGSFYESTLPSIMSSFYPKADLLLRKKITIAVCTFLPCPTLKVSERAYYSRNVFSSLICWAPCILINMPVSSALAPMFHHKAQIVWRMPVHWNKYSYPETVLWILKKKGKYPWHTKSSNYTPSQL